jgi:hypothetical protein
MSIIPGPGFEVPGNRQRNTGTDGALDIRTFWSEAGGLDRTVKVVPTPA